MGKAVTSRLSHHLRALLTRRTSEFKLGWCGRSDRNYDGDSEGKDLELSGRNGRRQLEVGKKKL
jgi:hypothetical protein